ncbi:MAG: toprim domain-containing protein [Candidatus Paceibacterota bacterium]|jgi:recombination protein RecR
MLPSPIEKFIEIFSKLPGVGPRQATRLAFYFINSGKDKLDDTARAINNLKSLKLCAQCFAPHLNTGNFCDICKDPKRDKRIIAVVEKETDQISLEKTKKFKGIYLILGELSKSGVLENIQKLRLNHIKSFIQKEFNSPSASSGQGQAEEIILAISPTSYGDLNALVLIQELRPFAKKITRLGQGIPRGGEIEFADEDTLGSALDRRV